MTKAQRAAMIAHIDANTNYDISTVRVHRDGTVTAVMDADKTLNGPHNDRILVGYADDLLAEIASGSE